MQPKTMPSNQMLDELAIAHAYTVCGERASAARRDKFGSHRESGLLSSDPLFSIRHALPT